MRERARIDFDDLLRHLMIVGFAALAIWTLLSMTGVALGIVGVSPRPTLRFLLSILVLVFARRTYWEVREWRWRRLPPDERYGFSSPIGEHPRSTESGVVVEDRAEGAQQPRR